MSRVISDKVSAAVENWKNGNFSETIEFVKSCQYSELVEFGYLVEESDIDIKDVLIGVDFEDCSTSIDVLDTLDGVKEHNARRVQTSWSAMNDAETLILGVFLKRCSFTIDEFFDMLNS